MRIVLEKRLQPSPGVEVLIPIISVALALLACALLLILSGIDPLHAYQHMFSGAFGTPYGLSETVVKTIPLLLCALGVAFAFRMSLWNIGAEGQLYIGAMAATFVALGWGNQPPGLVIPLMLAAGALAGGLWCLVAGLMRAYLGANEIITTLMMNYIAIYWVDYLVYGPWKDPNGYGFPLTAQFAPNTWLPKIPDTRIHLGLLLGLVLAAVTWVVLFKTRWGYEIRVTGLNPRAALYAGMNTTRNICLVMLISGALAGLAGVSEVAGIQHRLQHGFSPDYGYSAIIVAWLARLNPWAILPAGFFFGGLMVGGDQLQISIGLPVSFTYILQGAVLFFILGGEILCRYRLVFHHPEHPEAQAVREGVS